MGVVATIPVDAVRGRVFASLNPPAVQDSRFPPAPIRTFDGVLVSNTVPEALAAIRTATPNAANAAESYEEFLNSARLNFVASGQRTSGKIWDELRNEPEFEASVIEYLKKMVPAIFKNKYSRSLYEDIEFGLFLLGSSESFDVLEDIRHGNMQGISGLFARRHSAISRGLASVQAMIGSARDAEAVNLAWESFERKVSSFEQLCEIINKIAAMHSISALDKSRAHSLVQMIAAQIEAVGNELDHIGYDPFAREKLRFIEGKLLGNYSHLEFFEGRTLGEILRKAEKICEKIERGFKLQEATRFGGVPERKEIAMSVKHGNIASVKLAAVQKIKKLGKMTPEIEIVEEESIAVFLELYGKASGTTKFFENAEEVALDFVSRSDHDEFMIETMHHLMLFCNVSTDILCRVAQKLIGENQYHNAYHEEFKIKLFSVILEKLRAGERSERTASIAYWIREYARKNEKASGLVMSFSQLYISLAVFFASMGDENSKRNAMECYLRSTRVTDETWQLKFEHQETAFIAAIGGKTELERFEKFHSSEMELEIHGRLLALMARVVNGTNKEEANRAVCDIIEEFFYGICVAEIHPCTCESMDFGFVSGSCEARCVPKADTNTIRRGNRPATISLGQGHYLLLQYPANLETVFNRILDQRKDFIRTNISSLLTIITKDRELSEANQYLADAVAKLDRQIHTDALTGLANMRQYEDNLPLFADMPSVSSILVRIENLSEVNGAYGMKTGDEFIVKIADGPLSQFFMDSQDQWKVYRTALPEEFLIIGDYQADRNGIPFKDIVGYFHELFSTFTFYPKGTNDSGDEKDGLCLRPQAAISYSDAINTDIYERLHVAIQEAAKGTKVVAFDESKHSEAKVLENLRGGSILTEALKGNRVIPFYQAIIDNKTGRVEKYECLARILIVDSETGKETILRPVAFVDHAQRAGTIPLLTRRMFERVCQDLKDCDTKFSVNISWQDLADPEITTDLIGMMRKYGIAPERVTFEILEEALLSGPSECGAKLAEFKKIGCKIALDDFGSEGSNFSRFEDEWWPDVIKIDGPKFIKNLDKSPGKQRIVRAMVKAGQELGCEIVAEFVDNDEVWSLVSEMGIQYSQGFHFHEPQRLMPGERLPESIDITEMILRVRSAVGKAVTDGHIRHQLAEKNVR